MYYNYKNFNTGIPVNYYDYNGYYNPDVSGVTNTSITKCGKSTWKICVSDTVARGIVNGTISVASAYAGYITGGISVALVSTGIMNGVGSMLADSVSGFCFKVTTQVSWLGRPNYHDYQPIYAWDDTRRNYYC